jgi:hypothetical protein
MMGADGQPQSWFDRLCAALALTCPRGKGTCSQDFVVEFTGTWPGDGRCKACGRQFEVSEAGFKDRRPKAA